VQYQQPQIRTQTASLVNNRVLDQQSEPAHKPTSVVYPGAFSNQALQQLLRSRAIQAKLTVSQPGDQYEQQADRIADAVMRMTDSQTRKNEVSMTQGERIQRVCSGCEEELHRQPMGTEEDEALEAKEVAGHTPQVTPQAQASINSMRGGGRPLPSSVRGFFEPRFGRDFSRVRIHTDRRAAEIAGTVSARAFTLGRDIVFGGGQYEPGTTSGQHLLAHELAHVVQQNNSRRVMRQAEPDREDEFLEGLPGQSVRISKRVGALFGIDDSVPEGEEETTTSQDSPTETKIFRVPSGPATGNCSWTCRPAGAGAFTPTSSAAFNCYAYAMNSPGSLFLQPGGIAGTTEFRAAILGDPAAITAVGGAPGVLAYFSPAGMLRNMTADLGSRISSSCLNCCTAPKRKVVAVTTDAAVGFGLVGGSVGPVTSSGEGWDHHWYRKDADQSWSHKRDGLPSEQADSSGASPICSPCRIARSYPFLNYSHVVGSWCV